MKQTASETVYVFTHGTIFTPDKEITDGTLVTRGRTILSVGNASEVRVPEGAEIVDCTGKILTPGFMDLHLHGGMGYDVTEPDGLMQAGRFHALHGTTSMLPTLGPEPIPRLKERLSYLNQGYSSTDQVPLPEVLGFHLEGPFLNAKARGTFDPDLLSLPRPGLMAELHEASGESLSIVTLAPELPGGMDMIREIKECGIIPSLGHSDATYRQGFDAFSAGVPYVTHLFNAMRGFHHREPGCAAAALLHPDVTVEVILDGYHLHRAALQMIYKLKGASRMILVTDAAPLAGLSQGSSVLGGRRVEIRDGKAINEEGHLAGSLLTMSDVLQKAVHWVGIPLREALSMATANPARLVGASSRKGGLFAGADADLVILNHALEIQEVYIGGTPISVGESVTEEKG